jgi:hypothetical protein
LKALSVVIGQFSVTAVDARAHTATSSAGRIVDRFVPRIRIPFYRRIAAPCGGSVWQSGAGARRRQCTTPRNGLASDAIVGDASLDRVARRRSRPMTFDMEALARSHRLAIRLQASSRRCSRGLPCRSSPSKEER